MCVCVCARALDHVIAITLDTVLTLAVVEVADITDIIKLLLSWLAVPVLIKLSPRFSKIC